MTAVTLNPVAVDVARAALLLGCGKTTIRGLLDEGLLPTVPHMGRRVLIPVRALEQLANSRGVQ